MSNSMEMVKLAKAALADKKAEDITIIDISEVSDLERIWRDGKLVEEGEL